MLAYLAELHDRSTYPAEVPLPYPFETPGSGYAGGKCFGPWDTVHVALDAIALGRLPHALHQIKNIFALQESNGFLPGLIYYLGSRVFLGQLKENISVYWDSNSGWPPVWTPLVDKYVELTNDTDLLDQAYRILVRQIDWFEKNRSAEPFGFFYRDILDRNWESGVDEGVRFDNLSSSAKLTCVDATSHVWALYDAALSWGQRLGKSINDYSKKRENIKDSVQTKLFDHETGFFYDIWIMERKGFKTGAFEGFWPLVVGLANESQAERVIDENLLNPLRFFTPHPISTVAKNDPVFENRMWRGPAWNSMTYWAAVGCMRYGRADAAKKLLEAALDKSAVQFDRTGTIWEFYDPDGGPPENLKRKPDTQDKIPCRDYTGHNPLCAMASLWQAASEMTD